MDEYDDAPPSRYGSRAAAQQKIVLPTAPRAALGPDLADELIPRDPPFTAYVANLPYDIDEEEIMEFFSNLRIKGVRLPRDGESGGGRLKGFGYADFEDRESLVEALSMNEQLLKNRKIRIDLASGGRDRDSGFSNRRMGSRYESDPDNDRTLGDWRSGPPPEPRGGEREDRYGRGGGRDGE